MLKPPTDASGKVLGYSHSYSNDDGSSGKFFDRF